MHKFWIKTDVSSKHPFSNLELIIVCSLWTTTCSQGFVYFPGVRVFDVWLAQVWEETGERAKEHAGGKVSKNG